MAWQYRVITGGSGGDWLERELAKLDAQGFEIATHVAAGTPTGQVIQTVIMKKEARWARHDWSPQDETARDEAGTAAGDVVAKPVG